MTSLTDRTIDALHTEHDALAPRVADLSGEQLEGPSAADGWTIAQVLSHLGSGSEIMLASLSAAVNGGPRPADGFNQGVWDRWNALAPAEQAAGWAEHDDRLLGVLDALDSAQRESLEVDLGFLPQPLPLAGVVGMRLNEVALHTWDALAGLDADAEVPDDAARVMLEQFSGMLGFLLGFVAKPDALGERTVLEIADTGYAVTIEDTVSIGPSESPTATLAGPIGAAPRLLAGRLKPGYLGSATVSGNVTLDDLHPVFPGF